MVLSSVFELSKNCFILIFVTLFIDKIYWLRNVENFLSILIWKTLKKRFTIHVRYETFKDKNLYLQM